MAHDTRTDSKYNSKLTYIPANLLAKNNTKITANLLTNDHYTNQVELRTEETNKLRKSRKIFYWIICR